MENGDQGRFTRSIETLTEVRCLPAVPTEDLTFRCKVYRLLLRPRDFTNVDSKPRPLGEGGYSPASLIRVVLTRIRVVPHSPGPGIREMS